MYKLTYAKFTNVMGFIAGIGKKTVEINLRDHLDKDVFIIVGDNGSGKSTLMSLIHPAVYPVDGRTKFIAPGKEGTVIREYTGDDGSVIISKCIYKPKRDGSGHTPSCYLELCRPGEDPVELNPNGNVSSYQGLLYTYFGITKDYLSFASYNAAVADIVTMNDTERKNSVGTMVPNTKRFEIAYDIVNDKYRNLRNLIRNVSQKILSLRDEASLEADFSRLTREIKEYNEAREEHIRKLAKMEGRLKELTAGQDVNTMMTNYDMSLLEIGKLDRNIGDALDHLRALYKQLGIKPDGPNSINFSGIDKVPSMILKYEKKIASEESDIRGYNNRQEELYKEIFQLDKEISEANAALYSIQSQDIDELQKVRAGYLEQLKNLRYTSMKDQFEGMSYDEIITFSRMVTTMDQMIRALYDEYGELLSEYFLVPDWNRYYLDSADAVEQMVVRIQTASAKRDQVYRDLVEKEQYKNIQQILNQRPKTCTIDSCPFIANALKYRNVANEIAALTESYQESGLHLTAMQEECASMEKRLALHNDAQRLVVYISGSQGLIEKYLGVNDLKALYKAIGNGTWESILDIMKLKSMASILSEKDLYNKIQMQRLPEVEHAIEMAKIYGTNRDLLMRQLDQLNQRRDLLKESVTEQKNHLKISTIQMERNLNSLKLWKSVSEYIQVYREAVTARLEASDTAESMSKTIDMIQKLLTECKEKSHIIDELDDLIRSRTPLREQVKLDLDAVRRLQIEKNEIERDFIVVDVIRSIIAPGKGIRKELINIYMYDIYTIANQLLLNTFNGQLYLKELVITDKSFIIPYVYNGAEAPDISVASAAQRAAIASAISLAILSKLVDKYGIYTGDEQDGPLNPKNKGDFINVLLKQMKYVGIVQAFLISQEPRYYESLPDVAFICFPGGEVSSKHNDVIQVS